MALCSSSRSGCNKRPNRPARISRRKDVLWTRHRRGKRGRHNYRCASPTRPPKFLALLRPVPEVRSLRPRARTPRNQRSPRRRSPRRTGACTATGADGSPTRLWTHQGKRMRDLKRESPEVAPDRPDEILKSVRDTLDQLGIALKTRAIVEQEPLTEEERKRKRLAGLERFREQQRAMKTQKAEPIAEISTKQPSVQTPQ